MPSAGPRASCRSAQLLTLSIYWLGINAMWTGLHVIVLPKRMEALFGPASAGLGARPDHRRRRDHRGASSSRRSAPSPTSPSRAGAGASRTSSSAACSTWSSCGRSPRPRRTWRSSSRSSCSSSRPTSPRVRSRATCPTSCPASQVGRASALMGIMIILGGMAGVGIAAIGYLQLQPGMAAPAVQRLLFWPTVALGFVEVATMVVLAFTVHEGRAAAPREGRSWWRIGLSAWGTDILRERSYVWLLVSRLCYLAIPGVITALRGVRARALVQPAAVGCRAVPARGRPDRGHLDGRWRPFPPHGFRIASGARR